MWESIELRIMISACLLGQNCKYNGGNNKSEKLDKMISKDSENEIIPICPEVLGGLSTPRPSAEIVDGVVMNTDGKSVDRQFRAGAEAALKLAKDKNIDYAILQSRSPSCGVNRIYDGTFSGKTITGKGVFAQLLKENGIETVDIEDL